MLEYDLTFLYVKSTSAEQNVSCIIQRAYELVHDIKITSNTNEVHIWSSIVVNVPKVLKQWSIDVVLPKWSSKGTIDPKVTIRTFTIAKVPKS